MQQQIFQLRVKLEKNQKNKFLYKFWRIEKKIDDPGSKNNVCELED